MYARSGLWHQGYSRQVGESIRIPECNRTPLLYTFREREMVYDIFEMCCGARMTVSYIRYGGVVRDAAEKYIAAQYPLLQQR